MVLELKRYLFLYAMSQKRELESSYKFKLINPEIITPSPLIERLCRILIIGSEKFRALCQDMKIDLNQFKRSLRSFSKEMYNATRKKIQEWFRNVSTDVWPAVVEVRGEYLRMTVKELIDFQDAFGAALQRHFNKEELFTMSSFELRRKIQQRPEFRIAQRPGELHAQLFKLDSRGAVDDLEEYQRQREEDALNSIYTDPSQPRYLSPVKSRSHSSVVTHSPKQPSPVFISHKVLDDVDEQDEEEGKEWVMVKRATVEPLKRMKLTGLKEQEESNLTQENKQVTQGGPEQPLLRPQSRYENQLKLNWQAILKASFQTVSQSGIGAPQVIEHLERQLAAPQDFIELLVRQYLRFMILLKLVEDGTSIIPPYWIQLVWQYHVLQVHEYSQFCKQFFGQFVKLRKHPIDLNEAHVMQYDHTLHLYRMVYCQDPPGEIWGQKLINYEQKCLYKFIDIMSYMESVFHEYVNGAVIKKERIEEGEVEKAVGGMEMQIEAQFAAYINARQQ